MMEMNMKFFTDNDDNDDDEAKIRKDIFNQCLSKFSKTRRGKFGLRKLKSLRVKKFIAESSKTRGEHDGNAAFSCRSVAL
jgi:hypothetical protein